MSLLNEIQIDLLNDKVGVGQILRKIYYLASKNNLTNLEEWVRHETFGYPENVTVPLYRKALITYTASFYIGCHHYQNVSIPRYFINEFAGENCVWYKIRDGLPVIDRVIINTDGEKGTFRVDSSDLILLLQGKINPDINFYDINNRIDIITPMIKIQEIVRLKVQDFVLELENQVPSLVNFSVGTTDTISEEEGLKGDNIAHKILFENVTNIHIENQSQVFVNVIKGDKTSLVKALEQLDISSSKANELIIFAEQEIAKEGKKSLVTKIPEWLSKNIGDAFSKIIQSKIFDFFSQYIG